jgi:hypothetical protein
VNVIWPFDGGIVVVGPTTSVKMTGCPGGI